MLRGLTAIPRFHLYGEPHRIVNDGFVHIEQLYERSSPGGWQIAPHIHTELNHFFWLSAGGGVMSCDGRATRFHSPCLLLLPAGVVHGFAWDQDTAGLVITVETKRLEALANWDTALSRLFAMPRAVPLGVLAHEEIDWLVTRLRQENAAAAPGHRAAIDAWLIALMVTAIRGLPVLDEAQGSNPTHHRALMSRFRARIEERFRLREPVSAYAEGLNVTISRLQTVCGKIAGQTPSDMIDERVMREAKRSLLYTDISVSEIAYSLGFSDPAYFTRFFTRHEGQSPGRFRRARTGPAALLRG